VGIELVTKDHVLTVIAPIEDTPAWKAGLKPGDRIVRINGESTKGLNLTEAVSKMRGKKGSDVSFTIIREGSKSPIEFVLRREEIKVQTAKSEVLENGYLYLRLAGFNEHSSDDLKKAMEKYEKKNGSLKGLVLDLRNNPGGLLDEAVNVSSLFVDEGIIVSTEGRGEDKKEVRFAKKGMARKDISVAVLVNGASASASEIVAGALQDHKRAIVLGQQTFGKGSVQTVVELAPEVGLKLTIARYKTPLGRSIQLKGIEPDVILDEYDSKTLAEARDKRTKFIREKDLRNHIIFDGDDEVLGAADVEIKKPEKSDENDDKDKNFVAKEDYQVREALNYLKSHAMLAEREKKMEQITNDDLKQIQLKAAREGEKKSRPDEDTIE
jgi:carboxyl-terminal processing protease